MKTHCADSAPGKNVLETGKKTGAEKI